MNTGIFEKLELGSQVLNQVNFVLLLALILLEIFYVIYALIMAKQIKNINKSITTDRGWVFNILAVFHTGFAAALLASSILILLI